MQAAVHAAAKGRIQQGGIGVLFVEAVSAFMQFGEDGRGEVVLIEMVGHPHVEEVYAVGVGVFGVPFQSAVKVKAHAAKQIGAEGALTRDVVAFVQEGVVDGSTAFMNRLHQRDDAVADLGEDGVEHCHIDARFAELQQRV